MPSRKTLAVVGAAIVLLLLIIGAFIYVERGLTGPAKTAPTAAATPVPAKPPAPPRPGAAAMPPAAPGAAPSAPGFPAPPPFPNISQEKRNEMLAKALLTLKPAYGQLYAEFFRENGMTAEQANALLDLLMVEQQRTMERMMTLDPSTGRPNLPTGQEMQQEQQNLLKKIGDDFGYGVSAKFEEYRKTVPDRSIVQNMQRTLKTPLTSDQSSQVTSIIGEERQEAMRRASGNPQALMSELQAMGTRVQDRVQGVLSPEQSAALAASMQRMTSPPGRRPTTANPASPAVPATPATP